MGHKQLLAVFMSEGAQVLASQQAAQALPPGSVFVLRCFADQAKRPGDFIALRSICMQRRLVFVVSSHLGLAVALHADGFHAPEALIRSGRAAPWQGWRRQAKRLLTASAHSAQALRRAVAEKADLILLSPVFPTASHLKARCLGPGGFSRLARLAPGSAVIPLGGMGFRASLKMRPCRIAGIAFATPWHCDPVLTNFASSAFHALPLTLAGQHTP